MYKFSKFSKFISACFSFGILFSRLQTYGMNLTKPSVLDGIKVVLPEQCKFCSQKVLRVVAVPNGRDIYICRDNDCLKKIFDKFNIKLNTENIHRCDWFKTNMQKFQAAKAKGLGDEYPFNVWKIFYEDKLVDEDFLPCGHSICRCGMCLGYLLRNNGKAVCTTCKAIYDVKGCIFFKI